MSYLLVGVLLVLLLRELYLLTSFIDLLANLKGESFSACYTDR